MSDRTEGDTHPSDTTGRHDILLHRLLELTGQGIGWADLDGNVVYLNPALRGMLELAPEEDVSGCNLRRFYRPEDSGLVEGEMLAATLARGGWSGELALVSAGGRVLPTRHDVHLVHDGAGAAIAIACVITDLSRQQQHEQNLYRSKAKYRALVENIPQRVFYKDLESRYLAANRRYAGDLGVPPQDIIGQDDYAFHPRELADKYRRDDQRVMASGQVEECDERYVKDGQELTIRTIKTPVRGDRGEVIGVCGIFEDVTERRQLEDRLRESEANLRAIYEGIQEGMLVASAETCQFVMANPAICHMLGYSEAELLTMAPLDLHPAEASLRVREHFRAMERGDFSLVREMPFLCKDGDVFYADVSATLVNIQGKTCFLGVFRDVTEIRRAREALAASEALLTEAQALAHLGNWNLDLVTGQSTWSDEAYRLLGHEPGAVAASLENFLRAVHADDRAAVTAEIQRAMTLGETRPYRIEHRVQRPDGEHIVEQRGRVVFDAAGQPLRMYGTSLDVSEKRATEAALRRSEETYARAEAIAHIGSWDWDIASGELRWTDEIFRIFGQTPQSFGATYQAFLDAVHPDDRQRVIAAVNASVADAGVPYAVEHRVVRPDGELRVVDERGKVYRDERGTPIRMIGSVHDISERKQVDAELAQYRDHLEELVRARTTELMERERQLRNAQVIAHLGHWSVNLQRGELAWSDEVYRIFGHQPRASFTPSLERFYASVHPDDLDPVRRAQELAFAQGGVFRIDHRIVLPDGAVRWVHEEAVCERDAAGRPLGMTGTVQDITERKRAEAEILRAKDAAERANRAKSEFLSHMSHELRTPLNAILGFGQLLEKDPAHPLARTQRENVREILHAGRHLLDMINEVLDLARIESGKLAVSLEPVSVASILRECLALAAPLAQARDIHLSEPSFAVDLGVMADRTRLKQVLLNLLSNAVKYNRDGGSVTIACTREGDAVRLAVSDTGPGLAAEQQAALFMPFERLGADQGVVEGTGIGLALSKRLTELMWGEIGVDSAPGAGSTFWLRLPAAPGEVAEASAASAGEAVAAATTMRLSTVLYIEDNAANLRLMARILSRRKGIRLLTAERSDIGLELAVADRPDLILLDINLPDMDGFAVLSRLRGREETRAIPVIALSANAMPQDLEQGRAAGFADYLTKPLEVDRLLRVVDGYIQAGDDGDACRDEPRDPIRKDGEGASY